MPITAALRELAVEFSNGPGEDDPTAHMRPAPAIVHALHDCLIECGWPNAARKHFEPVPNLFCCPGDDCSVVSAILANCPRWLDNINTSAQEGWRE